MRRLNLTDDEFPSRSLTTFLLAFAFSWLIGVVITIFGRGDYEAKWSPEFNALLELGGLLLLLPVIGGSFSLGIYSVKRELDPWAKSIAAGITTAVFVKLAGVISARVQSEALAVVILWGNCLTSCSNGSIGAYTWKRAR